MTIVAGSLAGIPFLSGFWSKDAILASTLNAGYSVALPLFAIAVITALLTAFYSFRMIGLAFFGKGSEHIEKREKEGHHIHEAPKVMWIPYSILAAATVVIGIVGLFLEESLHEILGHNLEHQFENIHIAEASAGINPIALLGSLSAVGIGGFIAYYYYIAKKDNPWKIVEKNSLIKGIYRFFDNRWYINALYYWVFVKSTDAFSRVSFKIFELGVIDKISMGVATGSIAFSRLGRIVDVYVIDFIANGIAGTGKILSDVSRKIQTGITEEYVFAYVVGVILLALTFFYIIVFGL
jgi:NADH-quinone oxidoreductase subunit L